MKTVALLLVLAAPSMAETVVPTRIIRAKEIIGSGDITVNAADTPGSLTEIDAVLGQEARIALYPGRPVRPGDIGPPALVERNDRVTIVYVAGALRISTDGRVLDRGAAGETVRVMNLSSRQAVLGRIRKDGVVEVR